MELEIIGGSKTLRKHIENAAWVAFYELMPKAKKLHVTIEIAKSLDDDADGYCIMYNRKTFIIEIKKTNLVEMVKTIFHEMTHVKQYYTEQLTYNTKKGIYTFKNKKYSENIGYENYPWEIKAFKKELKILEKVYEL